MLCSHFILKLQRAGSNPSEAFIQHKMFELRYGILNTGQLLQSDLKNHYRSTTTVGTGSQEVTGPLFVVFKGCSVSEKMS